MSGQLLLLRTLARYAIMSWASVLAHTIMVASSTCGSIKDYGPDLRLTNRWTRLEGVA